MSTATLSAQMSARPAQNWVISPVWDLLTIIAAPVLWMACFGLLLPYTGPEPLITFFMVFNIAHHMPTFIRVYGDRDLLRRFRWNILLAPVIPFAFILCVYLYLINNNYPHGLVLSLVILLTLWDPWHFLMQDYGFARIYDRHNAAPRALASWMDYALCASWFAFVMAGALNWFPEILYDLYCNMGVPLLFWFDAAVLRAVEMGTLGIALATTAAYLVYLAWCRARGYWISPTKLAFVALAFGMLYLAYVPNRVTEALVRGWDFTLGFAAMGMVHVTQYLAIVWKYNRGLAQHKKSSARPGLFRDAFAWGGPGVLLGYVLVCAAYGALVMAAQSPSKEGPNWLLGVAVAANFTSTLLHYYYDGFIWKIRHKENQQYLDLSKERPAAASAPVASWWDNFRGRPALATAARHALYFGLPLALMAVGIGLVHADPMRNPFGRFGRVKALQNEGRIEDSLREADSITAAMDAQLDVERHMIALRPTAAHYACTAELIYLKALLKTRFIDPHRPGDPAARAEERRREIVKAVEALEQALTLPGRLGNRADQNMTVADVHERLNHWRWEAGLSPTSP